jgi:RNA polymerase sigma factor (sigma-70 family)
VTGPGDASFEILVERYAAVIRATVRKVAGKQGDILAEDAEQEVRLAVWRYLSEGKKIDHPYSFLVKVATRIAVRMVKKARGLDQVSLGGQDAMGLEDRLMSAAEDHARGAEIRAAVARGLAQLTDRRRAAVRAYLAGMNHEEVARHHGWSPSSARHAIYDGLAALREHLKDEGVELAQA